MICVRLMGGLGNQMFQYAAGRALAKRHKSKLMLDTSFYYEEHPDCTLRQFQLDHLQIRPTGISEVDLFVDMEISLSFLGRLKIVGHNMFYPAGLKWYRFREKSYLYDQDFVKLPDNIYLDGYWQSEHYFIDVSDEIRKEFVPVEDVSDKCSELLRKILSTNSVSVHIRRGDYVTSPNVATVHGVCEPEYYQTCMREICYYVENPHFIIFSDDTDWVKRNFSVQYPHTIVEHHQLMPSEVDLNLMRFCKHNIIANSSYSWWGAWLNTNPEKIVFAPKKWFAAEWLNTDIVPEKWRTF